MTPADLRAALATLRWSNRTLAAELGVDEHRVRRWANGSQPIPEDVAVWLAALAAAHEGLAIWPAA